MDGQRALFDLGIVRLGERQHVIEALIVVVGGGRRARASSRARHAAVVGDVTFRVETTAWTDVDGRVGSGASWHD